mmetsp:Transcript_11063/g.32817  ORF Transcript_11063/g.32817 Transcript_11063/m.32817 type:complete len:111 (+) Transcript_11063:1175-1507(+)
MAMRTRLCTSIHFSAWLFHEDAANAAGLLTMRITESPRRNILLTYRSLFTAVPLDRPFPPFECSVHISFTSSSRLCVQIRQFRHRVTRHIYSAQQIQDEKREKAEGCILR